MTRKYTESEIRDIIADNLQCIEPGMVLIDTEHYLPNYKGTKGFADILAKDCKDHLTVIEVKKSNSTAREAIHEVFKYLEGVKINKGLRDDEIRLLILSTEWDELLIPFSSLCQNSTVNIEGYRIQVSENRTLSSVKEYSLLCTIMNVCFVNIICCVHILQNRNYNRQSRNILHLLKQKEFMITFLLY